MDAEKLIKILTKRAETKEQILYTVFYVVAAVLFLFENVPAYVSGFLVIGAVLYNVLKEGKKNYKIEQDSLADRIIELSYLFVVITGVDLAVLYLLRVIH